MTDFTLRPDGTWGPMDFEAEEEKEFDGTVNSDSYSQYKVRFDEHTYEINAPDPEDQWDNGSYGLNLTVNSIHKAEAEGFDVEMLNEYDAIYGYDDLKVGDTAYIVVVEYTTGDTFGSHGAWTIPAIKKYKAEAILVEKLCGEPDPDRAYRPWDGYFEHVECISVLEMEIKG